MTVVQSQFGLAGLSDRLRWRLESLGVTLASVASDGWVTVHGPSQWIERLITDSAQFSRAVEPLIAAMRQQPGRAMEVWPGVWLVPLPVARRRRSRSFTLAPPVLVAMLLTPQLLDNEWLKLLCDTQRVDLGAATARIDRARLVSPAEVSRLAMTLAWMRQDSDEIDHRIAELRLMSQQLGEAYEELSLLYKLSTNMAVNQPPAHFLTEACREMQQVLSLRWMALQLVDPEPRLEDLAGQVFTAGPVGCDEDLLKQVGNALMKHHPAGVGPLVVDDTRTLGITHLTQLSGNLLVVWIFRENTPLGIFFGGDKLDGSSIGSVDSKLCDSLCSSLSIFLENMMLYGETQAMFMGTLHALTSSIDANDSYTRGHSERVALLARQLAEAAGLDVSVCERVYISGLLHDVGKIGVPSHVLRKTGRLTHEEFDLIKKHPQTGTRILADIQPLQDVIPGVLYHHERWDGGGYPQGLSGEDIPLFGRLICLADSCDAMCSNRTYRNAMGMEQMLGEVARCAGTHFDPALAEVFVGLDFEPFLCLLKKHQRQHVSTSG